MKTPTPSQFLRTLLCATFSLFLAGISAQAKDRYAFLLSCDGMRPDAIETLGEKKLPNLFRLMSEGASTKNARTDKTHTVTLPNHSSMITGRPVAGEVGHNWTSNGTPKLGQNLHRNKKGYVRSMFGVAHDHGLRTALFSSKPKFLLYDRSYDERNGRDDKVGEDDGKDKIDNYVFLEDIEKLMDKYLEEAKEKPFHLTMFHLRDTDVAGHKSGWDLSEGAPYLKALQRIDGQIGRLLEFVDSDQRLKGKTSIVITADHGGRMETKTHIKADDPRNYTIPFMVWGPGVQAGAELYEINKPNRRDPATENPEYSAEGPPPIRNGDAGNLLMSLLGLPSMDGSTINAKQDLRVAAPTPQ